MTHKELQRSSGPQPSFQQSLQTGPLWEPWGWKSPKPWGWKLAKLSCEGKTPSYILQVVPPPQWTWRGQHLTKENYSPALRSNGICLARLWTCLGPITSFFLLPSEFLFGTGMSTLCFPQQCILEAHCLSCFIWWQLGEEFCHWMSHTSSLIHIWFKWYLDETLNFRL